jgi:hypothetical protein
MPRLPNYRRAYGRRREDLVASAVAAALRTEGRVVEEGHRPEEGQTRSPDFLATIDYVLTAIEVTRLLPRAHVQQAEALVTRIETDVRAMLAPAITGVGGQVLLGLAYNARRVAERGRPQLTADTSRLFEEVRQTLDGHVVGPEPVDIESAIPWIIRADVTLLPGPQDGFYIVQAPDEAQQPDLDDFLARTIASKSDQHLGHAERAILAVDAEFPDADDLREAFDRSAVAIPWWRVYLVHGSDATLVFEERG